MWKLCSLRDRTLKETEKSVPETETAVEKSKSELHKMTTKEEALATKVSMRMSTRYFHNTALHKCQ